MVLLVNQRNKLVDQEAGMFFRETMKSPTLTGVGMGFRDKHASHILKNLPKVDWFELLIDNYLSDNVDLRSIDRLRESYSMSFHSVGMSIGSLTPFDTTLLSKIRELEQRWNPNLISDHFAWSQAGNSHFHELLPIPFTQEAIEHFVNRIDFLQNFMGRQILMENTSTYLVIPGNEMTEWQFINEVTQRTGCGLLLDINNVYVNAFNHGVSAQEFLHNIDLNNVQEIHLGGYEDRKDYYFDSHSRPVSKAVWQGYQHIMRKIPSIPTLLEWDNDIPEFEIVQLELAKAKKIIHEITNETCSTTI